MPLRAPASAGKRKLFHCTVAFLSTFSTSRFGSVCTATPQPGLESHRSRTMITVLRAGVAFALVASTLLTQLVFVQNRASARGANRTVAGAGVRSAPPEPFVLGADGGGLPRFTGSSIQLTVLSGIEAARNTFAPASYVRGAADGIAAELGPGSPEGTNAPEPPGPPSAAAVVRFDFDGDGKSDIGRWHAASTEFKVKNSNAGSYSTFNVGSSSAVSAPGDFNGDGHTDAAVFAAGTWTYKTSPSASAQTISFGTSGDVPVAGDYS